MRRTIIGAGYAGIIATCAFLACGGSSTGGSSGSSSGALGASGSGSGSTTSGGGSGSSTTGTVGGAGFSGSGFFNADAGFDFDAFTFPDNFALPDGFGGTPTGVCAQLKSCCDMIANGLAKGLCQLAILATQNDQTTCQQLLASYQDAGQCR